MPRFGENAATLNPTGSPLQRLTPSTVLLRNSRWIGMGGKACKAMKIASAVIWEAGKSALMRSARFMFAIMRCHRS